jgi:hypothetical protein
MSPWVETHLGPSCAVKTILLRRRRKKTGPSSRVPRGASIIKRFELFSES